MSVKQVLEKFHRSDNLLIVGDLNLPGVDLEAFHSSNALCQDLCDTMLDFSLLQYNSKPSRNVNGNILDLILCNKVDSVVNIDHIYWVVK